MAEGGVAHGGEMTRVVRASLLAVVGVAALAVYWRTAYPTITWWDSSSYSLAAYTLGVTGPPGSLLLTLLGWTVAHLPLGIPVARVLNMFAGVLATVTVLLLFSVASRFVALASDAHERKPSDEVPPAGVATEAQKNSSARAVTSAGIALGALTFAFSSTLWEYAVQFTPYVLTTVFTGLIYLVLLRWWASAYEVGSWRLLAVLAFLFGLDFSVHRTNALLIPCALVWIYLRRRDALREMSNYIAGAAGIASGLAVQLLLIPIARRSTSPMMWDAPTDFSSFWRFVSLDRLGGGFMLGLLPRKSNFLTQQWADLIRVTGDNFANMHGPFRALGVLTFVAVLFGTISLTRSTLPAGFLYNRHCDVHRFRRDAGVGNSSCKIEVGLAVANYLRGVGSCNRYGGARSCD